MRCRVTILGCIEPQVAPLRLLAPRLFPHWSDLLRLSAPDSRRAATPPTRHAHLWCTWAGRVSCVLRSSRTGRMRRQGGTEAQRRTENGSYWCSGKVFFFFNLREIKSRAIKGVLLFGHNILISFNPFFIIIFISYVYFYFAEHICLAYLNW